MTETAAAEKTVRAIIDATDAADVNWIADLVTEDIRLQFGSEEPTVGKQVLMDGAVAFNASIASIRHDVNALWTVEPDVVVTEMMVHYERLDGQGVSLPCTNIFRVRDGKIADYRVYMDIAPVFA
jgi:ketosteroid isomerase-like protein